jgi:hypothetical protein
MCGGICDDRPDSIHFSNVFQKMRYDDEEGWRTYNLQRVRNMPEELGLTSGNFLP